jgi:hypothetical protein
MVHEQAGIGLPYPPSISSEGDVMSRQRGEVICITHSYELMLPMALRAEGREVPLRERDRPERMLSWTITIRRMGKMIENAAAHHVCPGGKTLHEITDRPA